MGFIDFWITFDSSTVAQICVDEAYRRNHIGTELVKFMINLLKENDVLTCTLEVRASNIIAQDFYKKLGFTNIIKKNNYYVDGEDAIYMMMEVVNV